MLVSVLMPAFNAGATIRQAITSLLRQSYGDFEIVVVDDGSTDNTGCIVRELASVDHRIRYLRIPHSGIVCALNAGIDNCSGDLIARMDADDVCHSDRLKLQVEMMRANPDLSVCGCLVHSFPRGRVKGGFLRYEAWLNSLITHEEIARDIFVESPLAHPSVVVRAADLREVGGYREMGWPEDYDLWLRLHVAGKRFGKVPRVLLFWRETANRLTFTDPRYSLENFMRLKGHFLSKLPQVVRREVIVWGAGMTGRRLMKHLIREGVAISAVVDIDPRKIGGVVRGAPVISPVELANHPQSFVIAAVGSEGARDLIRARLREMGRVEGEDFVCAA